MTTISVLTPTLNEEQHIREAAERMLAQRLDGEVEFIFVDGRSTDRTRDILEELATRDSRVRVLDNPERRMTNALNIALAAANGDFIARMDAHTHYPPDYLAHGIERLRAGDVDWVSGPAIAMGVDRGSRLVALALSTRLGTGWARFRRLSPEEEEVDTGFTGIWRRSTLERFGGWDEGWPQDQDYELAARMREAGNRIVSLPSMAAAYIPRNDLRALARQYWIGGMYRTKTSRAHPENMRRSHVLPPGLVLTLLAAGLAPAPLQRPAQRGLLAYGCALAGTSVSAAIRHRRLDALLLPAVFVTMHGAMGAGFLYGCGRFGPPWKALARAAGLRTPQV